MTSKKLIFPMLPLFLLLFSCSQSSEVVSNYSFLQKKDENITLLFSDDSFIHAEGNYYDALLDVKKRYPEKIRSLNIIHSSDRELIKYYEIREFPTLLVIHNDLITVRIEGTREKVEILKRLEEKILYFENN